MFPFFAVTLEGVTGVSLGISIPRESLKKYKHFRGVGGGGGGGTPQRGGYGPLHKGPRKMHLLYYGIQNVILQTTN